MICSSVPLACTRIFPSGSMMILLPDIAQSPSLPHVIAGGQYTPFSSARVVRKFSTEPTPAWRTGAMISSAPWSIRQRQDSGNRLSWRRRCPPSHSPTGNTGKDENRPEVDLLQAEMHHRVHLGTCRRSDPPVPHRRVVVEPGAGRLEVVETMWTRALAPSPSSGSGCTHPRSRRNMQVAIVAELRKGLPSTLKNSGRTTIWGVDGPPRR